MALIGESTGTIILAASWGGVAAANQMLPGATTLTYLAGTACAIAGAVGWQFLLAQAAREQAAAKGIPAADRPRLDWTTLLYAVPGSMLSAGIMLWAHDAMGGGWNFLSIGAFSLAGAAGPRLAIKMVDWFLQATGKKPA